MSLDSVAKLVDEIKMEISDVPRQPDYDRSRLIQLVDDLKLAVETPTETILRLIYQPPENAALRIVVDLGIFPLVVSAGTKSGISATDLAKSTGADLGLVIRLMRVMTALGLIASPEPGLYHPTEKTVAMTEPIGRDGVPCIYDLTVPTLSKLPEYFRLHGYRNPQDYSTSPMKWAVGQSQFEWLAQHKEQQELFNSYMSNRRQGKPDWFSIYPVERLFQGSIDSPEAVFLVDVGGNKGHDLTRFHTQYPKPPGRLVLQDLPTIISDVHKDGIETVPYSFLNPQPIKNARAYCFRAIFHDWPDMVCERILLNTVTAMDPEYSRIIIIDFVLPDTKTSRMQSAMDIQMLSIGAGVERSRQQWVNLLGNAGLKVTGIWKKGSSMESIIEAVPVSSSTD